MTAADHIAKCKAQALAYLGDDRMTDAVASMVDGLRQHPGTAKSESEYLAAFNLLARPDARSAIRAWIEGVT